MISRIAESTVASDTRIGLDSLIRFRWGTTACIVATLLVVTSIGKLEIAAAPLALLVGVAAGSNLGLMFWRRSRDDAPAGLIGVAIAFDTLILTALLFLSGGPSNPFSILYLVHVTLAAVMLPDRWLWSVTTMAMAGYGTLFLAPGAESAHMGHEDAFSAHLQSMWIAFIVAAALIAHYVAQLARRLRAREHEVLSLRERAHRSERLASLTTLAAGAAHELNTPLGTVAVIARELERRAEQIPGPVAAAVTKDAKLIRSELDRCRDILEKMSASESAGEGEAATTLAEIGREVQRRFAGARAERLRIACAEPEAPIVAPQRALVRVVTNLVSNAFDASPDDGLVDLRIERGGRTASFTVEDRGTGMTREVAERAVEPFFTTKSPGRGLGLGLFLARSFADSIGGSLEIRSKPKEGTTVTLVVPSSGMR
jgi:two-component system, sensor histidine kinase RegB